ncbi:ubiquitin-conjugating enzyme E2 [Longispora sp. K20-0274]|uniref:ubiquitin-conjugating enzyme E2 n=1 Tax=Longispora sp. K20-0274 TaxID=3088255 RepID=UPI00399BD226
MPMKPYERRLSSEYRDMRELARTSSLIEFTTHGVPPTRYDVVLRCWGVRQFEERVVGISEHHVEITLDANFPLLPPIVVWKTPIFHPNIKPPHVCSGNIWYPAMSLAQFTVSLCEMVQYKSFNVYSALNDDAVDWVLTVLANELGPIPIDTRPVIDHDFPIDISKAEPAAVPPTVPPGGAAPDEPPAEDGSADAGAEWPAPTPVVRPAGGEAP